jgi:hypothetical protein
VRSHRLAVLGNHACANSAVPAFAVTELLHAGAGALDPHVPLVRGYDRFVAQISAKSSDFVALINRLRLCGTKKSDLLKGGPGYALGAVAEVPDR